MIIGDYLTADVFEIEDGSVWVLGFMSLAVAYVEACNDMYAELKELREKECTPLILYQAVYGMLKRP